MTLYIHYPNSVKVVERIPPQSEREIPEFMETPFPSRRDSRIQHLEIEIDPEDLMAFGTPDAPTIGDLIRQGGK